MDFSSLSITNSWSLLKVMSSELVMPSNHLILCCPLLLLPSIFPSIKVFSNESVLHIRWPKYWSFSFSISPSSEYSGFLLDWLIGSPCHPRDSQESSPTPQFKNINYLVLGLLYSPTLKPYMTTGETITLTIWIFVSKVRSRHLKILSRSIIAFLPRSKRLLNSWLQLSTAEILGP